MEKQLNTQASPIQRILFTLSLIRIRVIYALLFLSSILHGALFSILLQYYITYSPSWPSLFFHDLFPVF